MPVKNQPTEVNPTTLVDVAGAGKLLGLTTWQVRGLIKTREIPIVQVGNKFYMRRAALARWAERSEALVRG